MACTALDLNQIAMYMTCLIFADIKSHQFRAQVLGTTAVQVNWDKAPSWRDIAGYHIYYKFVVCGLKCCVCIVQFCVIST